MELSDLHVFRTVVQAGGITRAAERLHRVQSNVTTRIKSFEEDLGVALFLREGKRMQISPAGRIMLDYAERLLALADEAKDAVLENEPRGVFRLGSMESTAAARLPGPLSEFCERYSGILVQLRTGPTQQLAAQVIAGDLDAALVAEPITDPRLKRLVVFDEELVIIARTGHKPIAAPGDITKPTLLAFRPGCAYRKRLEDWFAQAGMLPDRVVEVASYHAMLGCAVAGMGVALVPVSVLDTYAERTRLSVHRLAGEFQSVKTLLVWRRGAPQVKVRALVDILSSGEDAALAA